MPRSDELPVSLGIDFGTESVRAVLVDAEGNELGIGTCSFQHGQIIDHLPGSSESLPDQYALQAPNDWTDSAATATRSALQQASISEERIIGIGVDFTSCTMLPTLKDGTPLCDLPELANHPLAWPKLWKHHGAHEQAERMTSIAQQRGELFLDRYGGMIGLEWFFPKLLETIELAPAIASRAEIWIEAGDWFVWKLVGGPAETLPRSTCQAGYKACWSAKEGFANQDYLRAVSAALAEAAQTKLPGRMLSPGQRAGFLTEAMAERLGLPAGIAVSAATIDAHAAVPGVGSAAPGTLVMVLGTSSCHMINAEQYRSIDGVAGIVEGGILPDFFGYETGQAAVGDAFAWLRKLVGGPSFETLSQQAMQLPPGAGGVRCVDWMHGCRTPLMDGALRGTFSGLSLQSTPAHLYRALLEASAFGLRWIVELLRDGGVPVNAFVATGGLPHHNPAVVKIYADVLGCDIEVHPSQHGPAVGAAVLGMVAAGSDRSGFETVSSAVTAMAAVPDEQRNIISWDRDRHPIYQSIYEEYRRLADFFQGWRAKE